jgi:hypothetical protein
LTKEHSAGLSAIILKHFALPALTKGGKAIAFQRKRDSCVIKLKVPIVSEINFENKINQKETQKSALPN